MTVRVTGDLAARLFAVAVPSLTRGCGVTDIHLASWNTVSKRYGLKSLGQTSESPSNPTEAIATLFGNGQAIGLGSIEPGNSGGRCDASNAADWVHGVLLSPN